MVLVSRSVRACHPCGRSRGAKWRGGEESNLPRCSWEVVRHGLSAESRMGELEPPGLHSNATPHHAPRYLLIEFFISTPIRVTTPEKRPISPPIETAADAETVTLSPKTVTCQISCRGYRRSEASAKQSNGACGNANWIGLPCRDYEGRNANYRCGVRCETNQVARKHGFVRLL